MPLICLSSEGGGKREAAGARAKIERDLIATEAYKD